MVKKTKSNLGGFIMEKELKNNFKKISNLGDDGFTFHSPEIDVKLQKEYLDEFLVSENNPLADTFNEIIGFTKILDLLDWELETRVRDFCDLLSGDDLDEINLDNFRKEDAKNIYSQEHLKEIEDKICRVACILYDHAYIVKDIVRNKLLEKREYLVSSCIE